MSLLKYGLNWKHQKEVLFERLEVESIPQLLAMLESLRQSNYYFRGISDAKRKVVSSIQRAWVDGGCWKCRNPHLSFVKFECGLLEFARKSEVFSFCDGKLMDHEIWAYLQHYNSPTPLIDFSQNPFVAVFFATEHASEKSGACSIYAIESELSVTRNTQDIQGLDEWIKSGCFWESHYRELAGLVYRLHSTRDSSLARFANWGFLENGKAIDESNPPKNPDGLPESGIAFLISKESNGWCPKITGGRINLQEGLFAYAPIECKSLEEFFFEKLHALDKDGNTEHLIYQRMKCFDIPASLVQELREAAKGAGMSRESLGLAPCEEENLVKTMYGAYLNSLCAGANIA